MKRSLSIFPLLIFAFSLVLILSFILFDLLDVDGSDFPRPGDSRGQWLSHSEGVHDFRRAWLSHEPSTLTPIATSVAVVAYARSLCCSRHARAWLRHAHRRAAPRFRPILPRASLGEAAAP